MDKGKKVRAISESLKVNLKGGTPSRSTLEEKILRKEQERDSLRSPGAKWKVGKESISGGTSQGAITLVHLIKLDWLQLTECANPQQHSLGISRLSGS